MKFQGKVTGWNDDKGFGFVEPNGGGDRAFVHIKAFNSRSRRPGNGDVIIYELARDNNNRFRAINIRFASDARAPNKQDRRKADGDAGKTFTMLFCIGLLVSIAVGKLPPLVAGLYVVMSIITFIAYAKDKFAAQNGRWRTPESTLHSFSTLGGWPGAYFAQKKLRHKSSKQAFKRVYWVTVLINLGGLCWLHTKKGAHFFNALIGQLPIS
ncbi:DUF1294 domain-containing protein [Motilimonas sp. KMU-193]|uniref:DUF1294 domain-containing protein n=1 Tax=Motilimonas sp. KMU-193 TaxID=3388668 RepID=UPI00396B1A9E